MRRNRRDSLRKERIIMITSSAFVLAALTMTGLYMKGQEIKEKDDGYRLDFTALENNTDQKVREIMEEQQAKAGKGSLKQDAADLEEDLDDMPPGELSAEVDSRGIEILGLTDHADQLIWKDPFLTAGDAMTDNPMEQTGNQIEDQPDNQIENQDGLSVPELHFSEQNTLVRPVSGDVILPYSMDGSIYFKTLDQYKYHDATVYGAQEDMTVSVCAQGQVVRIFENAEIGKAVTIDLGDGYLATYGQIKDLHVAQGEYVNAGDLLAKVAAPTKYYSLEGPNLYFKLEKDGTALNPENWY